jgi:RNA polymerase sigma-70 factor (ECF subfamily)
VAASDAQLVEWVLSGDRGAFAEIYARHQPALSRRLRRVLVRSEDVEDVLQATFVAAFRTLGRFRRDGSLAAWLHGIGIRCAANHLRSQRRRWWLRGEDAMQLEETTRAAGRSAEQAAGDRELLRVALAAVGSLPVDKRVAYSLHDLEGMSAREVGELLGCSEKTIWSRVESARRILAKKLRQHRPQGVAQMVDLEVKT